MKRSFAASLRRPLCLRKALTMALRSTSSLVSSFSGSVTSSLRHSSGPRLFREAGMMLAGEGSPRYARPARGASAGEEFVQHSLDVGHLGPHVEQHFVEQFPFKIARLGMLSAYVDRDSRLTAVVRQVFLQHLGGNHARLFDGGYLFGHILQLAYVAPPVVVFEHCPRLCVQRYRGMRYWMATSEANLRNRV